MSKAKSNPPKQEETMVYGKVPPNAKELEMAVLGAAMLEKGAFDQISELLRPECFYVDSHKMIFEAMQQLSRDSQPIDIEMVVERLKKMGTLETVGGSFYVHKLTTHMVSAANIEYHAHIVMEKYLKREIIRMNGSMITEAYEDGSDAFELMDKFENEYQQLTNNRTGSNISDMTDLVVERFKRMQQLQQEDQHITGIPSGFKRLDQITHGWQNTDLIILAARPSVGKTAFALNLARNAATIHVGKRKPSPVGLFSLEMSKGQLVDRLISAESEIWLDRIMTGKMEEAHLRTVFSKGIQPLSRMGIFIDDTPALNVYELRAKARRMLRKYNIGLIIIDYLQLMSGVQDRKINNREQEISNISRNLKKIAKELNIPIIALSQLSRAVEQRSGERKIPVLSDLRDSGAIEQDADLVMFMYRPDYYDISTDEMGESTKGLVELSIAKHRHGSLATGPDAIKLRARLEIQKFEDWTESQFPAIAPPPANFRPVGDYEKDEPF